MKIFMSDSIAHSDHLMPRDIGITLLYFFT